MKNQKEKVHDLWTRLLKIFEKFWNYLTYIYNITFMLFQTPDDALIITDFASVDKMNVVIILGGNRKPVWGEMSCFAGVCALVSLSILSFKVIRGVLIWIWILVLFKNIPEETCEIRLYRTSGTLLQMWMLVSVWTLCLLRVIRELLLGYKWNLWTLKMAVSLCPKHFYSWEETSTTFSSLAQSQHHIEIPPWGSVLHSWDWMMGGLCCPQQHSLCAAGLPLFPVTFAGTVVCSLLILLNKLRIVSTVRINVINCILWPKAADDMGPLRCVQRNERHRNI